MGPAAPAKLVPEDTPGRLERPKLVSTLPMAASTDHDSPGQVAAAEWSRLTNS
jgi:hypothetical protein